MFLTDNRYVHTMHLGSKPASHRRAVVLVAAVTSNAVQLVTSQPRWTGRLASNGAERGELARAQFLGVLMLTVPIVVEELTFSKEVKAIAELASLEALVILLGVGKRRVHTLAELVPREP